MSTSDNVKAAASGETAPGTMSAASVTDDMIKEALAKLDPTNDANWTSSGAPAMDAVNALLPASITRSRLDEVAPDFKRPEQPPQTNEGNSSGTGVLNAGIAPPEGHQGGDGVALGAVGGRITYPSLMARVWYDERTVEDRLTELEEDNRFLRKLFGWPTKDA